MAKAFAQLGKRRTESARKIEIYIDRPVLRKSNLWPKQPDVLFQADDWTLWRSYLFKDVALSTKATTTSPTAVSFLLEMVKADIFMAIPVLVTWESVYGVPAIALSHQIKSSATVLCRRRCHTGRSACHTLRMQDDECGDKDEIYAAVLLCLASLDEA